MREVFYAIPSEIELILERLFIKDWIVHNFNLKDGQSFYSPGDILHNVDVEDVTYTVYLDTNIYQFLLNSYIKNPTDTTRDAVALLVFCQICQIQIDPTYAVYEKINYTNDRVTEAIKGLNLFHRINNSETNFLISYSLGHKDRYLLGDHPGVDIEVMKKELTKYSRLTEWDSMYLIMLSCVSFSMKRMSRKNKLISFVNWMIRDFRQSLVGYIYAIIYFSECPLRRMMKYRATDQPELKRSQLYNMTWDLYMMNMFFRKWINNDRKNEFIYATDDKAFRKLLRLAIDIQINDGFEPLKNMISQSDYRNLAEICNLAVPEEERVYQSDEWSPGYRTKLIKQYENELVR